MDYGSRPHLSLIIPAYNEQARIVSTLESTCAYLESMGNSSEVIVVDDGSLDDTCASASQWIASSGYARMISYPQNRGKGYAVRQGVLASRGEYVGFSDVDLSAPIKEMAKLFAATDKGYDVAIGSRAAKGAAISVHQPIYRELGGKCLNLVIRALAVPGVHDTQCGLKLFRGEVARELFSQCFVDRWGFDVEVLYLARRMGYKIAEVGVTWNHAEGSKLRPFRAGLGVVRDIVRMRLHHYRLQDGAERTV